MNGGDRVWVTLRGFEGHVLEIEADVFTTEAAAREQAARIGGPTWETDDAIRVIVREEWVSVTAFADAYDD